jgi:hypothetical protein
MRVLGKRSRIREMVCSSLRGIYQYGYFLIEPIRIYDLVKKIWNIHHLCELHPWMVGAVMVK